MRIGRSEVLWNLGATILKVASGILLLPLVLTILPAEDVGLWTVFITVGSFTLLMDFGFSPAFARNITYIFSGVKELKTEGYEIVKEANGIDYSLLKGVLVVMRRYYLIMALILLGILLTAGSYYILYILQNYTGNYDRALLTWVLYIFLIVYQIYTVYYDALMLGRGLIRSLKQIIIISQILELTVTAILLICGAGIFSMAVGKFVSVVSARFLTYRAFFDTELLQALKLEVAYSPRELFRIISPNAVKIGISTLGGFLIQRSSFFFGSLYLTLPDVASYGITLQVLNLLSAVASIYISTYLPKITYHRINNDGQSIKSFYIIGVLAIIIVYMIGSLCLVFLGNPVLQLIHSRTYFMEQPVILIALLLSFIETNNINAGIILYTKNEVPFFKASILSGAAIFILMFMSFEFMNPGLYGLVLVPLMVNLAYQGWKWPLQVINEFDINLSDFTRIIKYKLSGIFN